MANFVKKSIKVSCGHRFLGFVLPQTRTSPLLPPPIMSARCFSSSTVSVASVSASSHLHRMTPWLMLPSEMDPDTGRKIDCFYSLRDKEIVKLDRKKILKVPEEARCFGSSRGWLNFIDPKDCSLYLSNPFRESQAIQLPPIETLPSVLGIQRHFSPRANIINQFALVDHRNTDYGYRYVDAESLSWFIVKHLSLSCDPFNHEKEDCVAMIVHGGLEEGQHTQLASCRVGKEKVWTTLIGAPISYPQTVCPLKGANVNMCYYPYRGGHAKLFYSMYSDLFGLGIDAWEIPKPWTIPARRANFMYEEFGTKLHDIYKFNTSERGIRDRCGNIKYLVVDELSGDIMLLIRHRARHVTKDIGTTVAKGPSHEDNIYADPYLEQLFKINSDNEDSIYVDPCQVNPQPTIAYKTLRFDVYKVNMKKRKLKRLQCLGDRVIFLGLNQSFTLSASEFPGLRPNSIYFTYDYSPMISTNQFPHGGHEIGIYNLEDDSVMSSCSFPDEMKEDKKIQPPLIWVAPNCSC